MADKRFTAEVRTEKQNVPGGHTHHWVIAVCNQTGKEAHIYFDTVGDVAGRMAAWFNTGLNAAAQQAIVQSFINI